MRSSRNRNHKPTRSGPPFNDLYDAFSPHLGPVFRERLPEGLNSATYVPVRPVERRLSEYLAQNLPDVCVLSGLMGSGKSTILEHFRREFSSANGSDDDESIFLYFNLQGRRHELLPPAEFYNQPADAKRVIARNIVTKRFNSFFLKIILDHKELQNIHFFKYLLECNTSEIGARAVQADTDDEKLSILKEFMSKEDQTAPVQCFLRYLAKTKGLKTLTVAIDNVDEQPVEIVEALFYVLSDFMECMNRRRFNRLTGSDDGECDCRTSFKAILACRSHTFEMLKRDDGGIVHTRGYREIFLDSGVILSDIIKSRLIFFVDQLEKGSQAEEGSRAIALRNGMRVTPGQAFELLNSLMDCLTESIDKPIVGLLNYNYGRAIRLVKYLTQNRFFVSFDATVLPGGSKEFELKYADVIKVIGYGNPRKREEIFFPAQSTVLTNVLEWSPRYDRSLFAVLKFLRWLEEEGYTCARGSTFGLARCTVSQAEGLMATELGLPIETTSWSIGFCHRHGLIFAGSGYKSPLGPEEEICLSPKGSVHLTELMRTAVFFELFIDDTIPPVDDHKLISDRAPVPTLDRKPTRQRFSDVANWLGAFLKAEKALLEEIATDDPGAAKRNVELFGDRLVTQCIAEAIDGVWDESFRYFCRTSDRDRLTAIISAAERIAQERLSDGH